MKRITGLLLCLGLCCGLFACGRAEAEVTTAEATTTAEAESTTEAPTNVFVPTSGEENGLKWRTLDLDAEENRETRAQLLDLLIAQSKGYREYFAPEEPSEEGTERIVREIQLSETKRIIIKGSTDPDVAPSGVWVRDETTGKETCLEGTYDFAVYLAAFDERYFLFYWDDYDAEWSGPYAVFDTEEMKEVPLEDAKAFFCMRNGSAYFYHNQGGGGDDDYPPIYLKKADIRSLQKGKPLVAVNLLKDIPEASTTLAGSPALSPGERYLAVYSSEEFLVFDLQTKFVWHIPNSVGREFIFLDAITLYAYDKEYRNSKSVLLPYALEITLP